MPTVKPNLKTLQKATIYTNSEWGLGIIRKEVYLESHGTKKYAQYDYAPWVRFVLKGKRSLMETTKTYQPYLLIVEGWDTPKVDDPFTVVSESKDVVVSQSRHMSFSDAWEKEADDRIGDKVKIIADYRYSTGFSSHRGRAD